MKKILFACDLDNTLIFSHKHRREGDICVETLDRREQGFMSPKTAGLLREINEQCLLIPVTTRSVEQYLRIRWPEGCEPSFAVTTNGAVLLSGGELDKEWSAVSQKITAPYKKELERLCAELSREERFIRCRIVDESYLFVYGNNETDPGRCAAELNENTSLFVTASGKKIYFLPHEINKGNALKRLKSRFSSDFTICAGDSVIDASMLELADLAIIPATLEEYVKNPNKSVCPDGERFEEFAANAVISRLKE